MVLRCTDQNAHRKINPHDKHLDRRPFAEKIFMLFGCVFQTQLKVDVSNLKEDISKLKSQIVESPEELKSQMEKMRENVKNIKTSIVSRKAE